MSIRRDPIYISYDVWKALRLIGKARSSEESGTVTPDEMADTLLREIINEKRPQVFELQKQIDKLEKELIKTL